MDRFQICDSLLIGHEQIDAEHQALVDVLNHGLDMLATSPQVEAMRDILDDFRTKLCEHVTREELIMNQLGFTEVECEIAEHRDALACLDDLIENHQDDHDFETLIRNIAGLMLSMFIKSDMSFKVYLEKINNDYHRERCTVYRDPKRSGLSAFKAARLAKNHTHSCGRTRDRSPRLPGASCQTYEKTWRSSDRLLA